MKISTFAGFIVIFISLSKSWALTPSTFLSGDDKLRLKGVFTAAQPYTELSSAHYSIYGLKLLNEAIPKAQEACNFIKSKVVNTAPLDALYHGISASSHLGNCQLTDSGLQKALEGAIKDDSSVQDIFQAVSALKILKKPVDSAKTLKILTAALKKDESILNLGYAFAVAAQLTGDVNTIFERIEDAIVQADEVDGKFLQFEGGLSITATIINGVFTLAETAKKAPALNGEQTIKFANYFLSRKFVQTLKGGSQLLEVLKILTTNKYYIPVAVTLASNGALSTKNPIVQVRVTNVLGVPLGPLTVTADSCSRVEDGSSLFTKKTLIAVQGDSSLYSLNLLETKPLRGFYKLTVSATATKPDSRMVGNNGAVVKVKVMTEVGVENVELGIVDRDQSTSGKTTKIEYPQKLKAVSEADYHQKLLLRFVLRDKIAGGTKTMTAHQTFVQLVHSQSKQEIVFVAEPDVGNMYKFDLDLNNKAKEFNYQSGKYAISLVIGDAVIANPISWNMGELVLTFPSNPNPTKPKEDSYAQKPEIRHLFREQEKTPALIVSNTFSALVLLPLLILFILWAKIGVNLSGFPVSLSSIGFHLGLAGILGLLVCFFLQLNMFTTLKYLALLSVFAFLTGHGLLSQLAAQSKNAK